MLLRKDIECQFNLMTKIIVTVYKTRTWHRIQSKQKVPAYQVDQISDKCTKKQMHKKHKYAPEYLYFYTFPPTSGEKDLSLAKQFLLDWYTCMPTG